MKLFDSLSVKLKVIFIIMVSSLAGLFLAIGVVFIYDQYMMKKNMLREINILGQVIADRSTAALSFNDPGLAGENLAALQAQPAVILACIFDQDNRPFAHYQRTGNAASQCPDSLQALAQPDVDHLLHVITPIVLNEERIGSVYFLLSTEEVQTRQRQYLLVFALVVMVVSLIVYLLSKYLQRPLLYPLLQLTSAARSIASNQDYSIRVQRQSNDEIGLLVDAFNAMLQQIAVREKERDEAVLELRQHREHLEELVAERTSELESFCYSVSHDLRAPLRTINGYSQIVLEDYGPMLDDAGRDSLTRVRQASMHMGELIDDLLNLSRTSRHEMTLESVDISTIAKDVISRLLSEHPHRKADIAFEDGLFANADPQLMRIALENLIGNAFKYTSKTQHTKLEFGATKADGETVFYVRDNGAGFDMTYVGRLFGPFQRLHGRDEFEGSGIGLAIVARIIKRHGGRIWAQGKVNEGATFYFTLSPEKPTGI
ncbi:MAG TPA: ATP-binding protein [Gammaproteobacteria bacterium]